MRTLSDGRVRRSEAEWREIVARYEESGLSEVAFCRRAKLSRQSFRNWRTRLSAKPRREASRKAAFVEWATPPAERKERGAASEVAFELELPGGATLRWKA